MASTGEHTSPLDPVQEAASAGHAPQGAPAGSTETAEVAPSPRHAVAGPATTWLASLVPPHGSAADRRLALPLTALVGALAAALRLPGLDRPGVLVFDETYYVKDAWSLVSLGYEGEWPDGADAAFEAGDVDGFDERGSYVVHPPVGKLLIGAGMRLVGAGTPIGWRLATAVAGVVAVLVLVRVGRRLLRSTWAGAAAALLLAVDGSAIAHSRTALLDGLLMTLLLGAFAALVADRDAAAALLARRTGPPRAPTTLGPGLGVRPWRLVAGLLLGLAVGTKWSALFFVAALGLLSVGWDALARRRAGVRSWWAGALVRDAPVAFASLVGLAAVVYVASWTGWLRTTGGYGRTWAGDHPGEGVTWLPEGLRSLWKYHQDMWGFHTGLTAEHPYAAHPAGWLLQLRPTTFFYESPEPAQQWCAADRCSQTVTSLGNPVLWWLAAAAVLVCAWWVVRRRDEVALAALAGIAAGWLPWFAYAHRTIFTFYAVVVLPWLVLCLVHVAREATRARGPADGPLGARTAHVTHADADPPLVRRAVVVGLLVVVLGVSAWFLPLWTGQVVPFRFWQLHMWLPGWV
ncbi:dolichyl-phosphate-mannose--protein mannosyltransferase [Cellulomonas carbonis]|uniref:Polyprenol-phosphate-mannose--protein mannosyltransferase n=1 Tax=Cellulomonas carbonis T26 TaxID=947969 RepID=A0A0A0BSW8_9CELL|nr:phospholipid carrier-dependent glycosyltransferase [Cellulomonas carbonis]KGM11056.1 membrane protein [Cellulomonas carbonis T26]